MCKERDVRVVLQYMGKTWDVRRLLGPWIERVNSPCCAFGENVYGDVDLELRYRFKGAGARRL